MKSLVLSTAVIFAVVVTTEAQIRTYKSVTLSNTDPITNNVIPDPYFSSNPLVQAIHTIQLNDGDAADWLIRILPSSSSPGETNPANILYSSSVPNWGWDIYENSFYFGHFSFQAPENSSIKMVFYGNSSGPGGTYSWIESAPLITPIIGEGPYIPGQQDVSFDFTGSVWQAIPEPGSVALVLAGFGAALLCRRKSLKQPIGF